MRSLVKKWGNSAAVRLPASLLAEARLELDQAVEVRAENGRIVIDPVRSPDYDLAALLAGITQDNLHDAADWGEPVGREVL
jgi:antitoxin MazE